MDARKPTSRMSGPTDEHAIASEMSFKSSEPRRALGKWRHVAGLSCLTVTIFLWTASNFMASTIFADDTYSKPYFISYVNTSFFMLPLLPMVLRATITRPKGLKYWSRNWMSSSRSEYTPLERDGEDGFLDTEPSDSHERGSLLRSPSQEQLLGQPMSQSQIFSARNGGLSRPDDSPLSFQETARLSLEFCILWFAANYLASACLQFTSVASATILNSTSSVFTLMFGALFRVERFSLPKVVGVFTSLAGIILISMVDLSGQTSDEKHRGDFPEKTSREIAVGDIMAILGAILYGAYAVLMKKRVPNESRVNMPLFFGLVGTFNLLLLWPGFFILHITGVERAELPPTSRVTMIILSNAAASLISDIAWVYAVLFTSPLVVTVGLSITIPLSLIGQFVLNNQTVGFWYWIGAVVIAFSFVLVSHESKKENIQPASVGARRESTVS